MALWIENWDTHRHTLIYWLIHRWWFVYRTWNDRHTRIEYNLGAVYLSDGFHFTLMRFFPRCLSFFSRFGLLMLSMVWLLLLLLLLLYSTSFTFFFSLLCFLRVLVYGKRHTATQVSPQKKSLNKNFATLSSLLCPLVRYKAMIFLGYFLIYLLFVFCVHVLVSVFRFFCCFFWNM